MEKREFKGIWIPKAIWLDKSLSMSEKLLLVEIDSYDNDFGCVATNKTLCEDIQIKPSTASGIIKSLEVKGYLQVSYRNMHTFEGRVIKFVGTPLVKSVPPSEISGGPSEISEPSNIFSNTLSNKDTKVSSIVGFPLETPTTNVPVKINYTEKCRKFIEVFNKTKVVGGKNGRYQSNTSLVNALKERLKIYSEAEIIRVLKNSMKDDFHKGNQFMYVTPEYILRVKTIEKYLNVISKEDAPSDVYTQVDNKIDHSNRTV